MLFEELGLIPELTKALTAEGYTKPTPIQAEAIPIILKGIDLLGIAQTGTGKTAAFSLPILQHLHTTNRGGRRTVKVLICTPTRELATQIGDSIAAYGKYTDIRYAVIFGGVSQHPQTDAVRSGVDILVATPGRLLDLIGQKIVSLNNIEVLVLDEADRMLDMGFIHDIKKILTYVPSKRQTLFFSATMPPEVINLTKSILHNPQKVEVTPTSSTVEKIEQTLYYVEKNDKRHLLAEILQDKTLDSVLVFTRTKHGADRVVKDLQKLHISAAAIHGNKSQNARQNALDGFKSRKIRVLVATDIAARGIDVDNMGYVINYEIPNIPETYVHRIGRTGRAGAAGKAMSFCDTEELPFLRDIQKLIGIKIPVVEDHPWPMAIMEVPVKPVVPVAKKKPPFRRR